MLRLPGAGRVADDRRQVDDRLHAGEGAGDRLFLAQIAGHQLEAVFAVEAEQRLAAVQERVEDAHPVTGGEQEPAHHRPQVAGTAGDQDVHDPTLPLATSRCARW